ncbi:MAG: flagellar hook-associated protein FlgL [Pseudobdellovibrio sp.]
MRITDKMTQNQVLSNIQKNRSELATLQNQAATGKKLTTPSEDPAGATKVLTNRIEQKNLDQYEKNIFFAKNFLETTESTMGQLGEALIRAKELALQAASDTVGGPQREMIGSEILQIKNSVLEMSNRRVGERYLFGGFKTQTPPFSKDGEYQGDDGEIKIQNQKGTFVAMNLTGNRVFSGRGIGVDNTYIRPSDDVPQDTAQLQDFKLAEADRQFVNKQEEDNYIETRGPASVGRVQSLSAKDPVTGNAGVNIFSLLQNLDVALKTNDKFAIQESLEPLDQALNQVNLMRAEIGGRLNVLNSAADGIHKQVVDNKSLTSQIEDADLFETMTNLNKADTALKGTLETSNKIIGQNLLDFIK